GFLINWKGWDTWDSRPLFPLVRAGFWPLLDVVSLLSEPHAEIHVRPVRDVVFQPVPIPKITGCPAEFQGGLPTPPLDHPCPLGLGVLGESRVEGLSRPRVVTVGLKPHVEGPVKLLLHNGRTGVPDQPLPPRGEYPVGLSPPLLGCLPHRVRHRHGLGTFGVPASGTFYRPGHHRVILAALVGLDPLPEPGVPDPVHRAGDAGGPLDE